MDKPAFVPHSSGFWFHAETAPNVCDTLARLPRSQRVRLFYGDTQTGKAWPEENEVCGYIGRSSGSVKVPLLIANRRSMGGGSILDHCIVAIVCTGSGLFLYRHQTFDAGQWQTAPATADGYAADVLHNGQTHARFNTRERAAKYCDFMRGLRFNY